MRRRARRCLAVPTGRGRGGGDPRRVPPQHRPPAHADSPGAAAQPWHGAGARARGRCMDLCLEQSGEGAELLLPLVRPPVPAPAAWQGTRHVSPQRHTKPELLPCPAIAVRHTSYRQQELHLPEGRTLHIEGITYCNPPERLGDATPETQRGCLCSKPHSTPRSGARRQGTGVQEETHYR